MKKYYLLIFSLCFTFCSFSQSTNISTLLHNKVRKADYFFDHFAYRNALEIYLQDFKRKPDDRHVRQRIASCYFKLRDPVSAELWYSGLANEVGIGAETLFEYAEVLSMNGKYDESMHWFKEYLRVKPSDKVAIKKLAFLKDLKKYTDNEERFLISTFRFNSPYAEYGAHFFRHGLVFASSRDKDLLIKRKPSDGIFADESFHNVYYAERNDVEEWTNLAPFHTKQTASAYHEGPMAFYDNFRKCAFTQSNVNNGKAVYDSAGKVNLRIYLADVSPSGEFGEVTSFEHNDDGYSNAHPSFSREGKTIYFSSTMPSGQGASDLYYSTLNDGRWTKPVNLGDAVNTREDESFPFIANDTTLYFSSNGHGGLGGLDIYVSYKRNGQFGEPLNLGSPLNTRYDDFSFVCDSLGRTGYIASNGDGGRQDDDIYAFTAKFYFLAGEVYAINGTKDKVSGVRISAFNSNGDLIDSTQSDSNGNFTLDLPFDQDFKIRGEKTGFETLQDLPFTTRGKPYGIDSLTLPLWKQILFSRGRIFSNETEAVLPGVSVMLNNLTDGKTDTLIVNESGRYEFLLKPGKKYRIEGTKEGYIPNGFNLDTKGIVEGELLNDIVLEEIYIDKQIVLFDYGKDAIMEGSVRLLNSIVRTMLRYPRATVNIGAHSDSRGAHSFNTQLSKRRAQATRDYLLSKGISAKRMELTWFGEELILNRCSDGVECPEEEHSRNRRAEIKVQKEPID